MKVALYGKRFDDGFSDPVQKLIEGLVRRGISLVVHNKFLRFLSAKISITSNLDVFEKTEELRGVDYMISIGGDGTMLEAASLIRQTRIPVLGINTGRLGFLSNVSIDEIETALENLINQSYTLDSRSLIEIRSDQEDFGDFPYALNELTLRNQSGNSMITIHAYVNDLYMSTYWADGLIVATPTGSTAYSLSCGGPIITPDSNNIILTPIAPHNLNVRPVVLSDTNKVSLRAEGRDAHFQVSLDSRSFSIDQNSIIELTRASFQFNLVQLDGQNFFNTIRTKMGWGQDKRN